MDLLQISAIIEGIASRKDGTFKLSVGTQELDEEEALSLIRLNRKMGWFVFKENPLVEADLINIPEIKPEFEDEKTPSQRLRNVLYVLWEQKYKKDYKTFDAFYKVQVEKIIDWVKQKLE